MQEELEVRLEESRLPAPEWTHYDEKSDENSESQSRLSDKNSGGVQYPSGHVKLELEG